MTINKKQKKECILELLIEKNEYMKLARKYKMILNYILTKCYSIGASLNDNCLQFNNKQLKFLSDICNEIKSVI